MSRARDLADSADKDIVGTLTVDGLTVDGDTALNSAVTVTDANVRINLMESDATNLNTRLQSSSGDFWIRTISDDIATTTTRLTIDHSTGDIAFYEDTGTTQKLFWDASAESLGIGTTSPNYPLDIYVSGANANLGIQSHNSTPGSYNQASLRFSISSTSSSTLNWDINAEQTGLTFDYEGSERMRIDSSGNVGIGTSSPVSPLHVNRSSNGNITAATLSNYDNTAGTSQTTRLDFGLSRNSGALKPYAGRIQVGKELDWTSADSNIDAYMSFSVYNNNALAERMRLNSSGHFIVGKTSTDQSIAGTTLFEDGRVATTGDGEATLYVNRTTSDGGLVILRRDGYDKGYIGIVNNELFIANTAGSDSGLNFGSNRIIPCTTSGGNRDNIIDLGNSASRFDDIYATNTSIQTSDQNEKQQIASLTDAEMNVAKRLSALFKTFKWNSSVEEKGDNARTHSGIIAQDMQQAFTDEGLDAGNYAMFISSTWWEKEISVDAVEAVESVEATYDEEGNELTPAVEAVEGQDAYTYMDTKQEATEGYTEKTRLGVRYPELFAFINAYNDQRFSDLEDRLTALEGA